MLNAVHYAEGCLAGPNSEVLRQTVVIRTADLPGSFVGRVTDCIAERLPPRGLRIKIIRCSVDIAIKASAMPSDVGRGLAQGSSAV